jgi:hypothetical protein
MFQTVVLKHNIKLQAREVGTNVREVVESRARALLEGVCGENGFIRPNFLSLVSMSKGVLGEIDMGRVTISKLFSKQRFATPLEACDSTLW